VNFGFYFGGDFPSAVVVPPVVSPVSGGVVQVGGGSKDFNGSRISQDLNVAGAMLSSGLVVNWKLLGFVGGFLLFVLALYFLAVENKLPDVPGIGGE